MTNINNLQFKREHFPIRFRSYQKGETKVCELDRAEIPPYHPSIKDGMDVKLAQSVLDEALGETVIDLEEIVKQVPYVSTALEQARGGLGNAKKEGSGILIENMPILGRLYLGPKCVNPFGAGAGGEHGLAINPTASPRSFKVPESVNFSPELKKEYGMSNEAPYLLGLKTIDCPNMWRQHNVERLYSVFYKNLVIAIDNAIMKQKYAKGEQK